MQIALFFRNTNYRLERFVNNCYVTFDSKHVQPRTEKHFLNYLFVINIHVFHCMSDHMYALDSNWLI